MDRRTLLGVAGTLGVTAAMTGYAPASAQPTGGAGRRPTNPPGPAEAVTGPARAALRRLLPRRQADQFHLTALGGPERFTLGGTAGAVEVGGTSAAVLLTGVHWYLKYTCRAHVSWAGSRLDLPDTLPAPATPGERAATVPYRFVLNDTHDGYTGPYADWPRWERLIDVLALHGCNAVLVTPGAEAVHHRVLTEFGYTDAEARAWLPAPSHQPWWLLQNLSRYGGPVSPGLLARRLELGRRIVARLRELGMSPVLPGCLGTVPEDFARRNPGAVTVPQGRWAGLRRPDWLDPRTEVFREVAAAYYRHQRELFGEADLVKMDLLHEGGTPGDVPVPEAARAVEEALRAALPEAVWVILGWRQNPRPELLAGVARRDRMLVVDGLSDLAGVTDRERDWGGVPYAFGTIPNFGGRTTLGAACHRWTERFTAWRDRPGSALVGTAYMPEAAERDPAAFELFSELAWRRRPVDRAAWFASYAALRYGAPDPAAERATAALADSVYALASEDGRPHDSLFAARPSLTARSGTHYATHEPSSDPVAVDTAFDALLAVDPALRASDAYRYDLTDLARQALANRSWLLLPQLRDAYEAGDRDTFGALAALWLRLMQLGEETAGAHERFLLGPWLADARRSAGDAAEADRLEGTARTLLTTWADRPTADEGHLVDYANRDWHGLIGDYYLPRWRRYLDALQEALEQGRQPAAVDWYTVEREWADRRTTYPERPVSDPYTTARRVREALATAPYQSTVTVSADPPTVVPGHRGTTLTAVVRNHNGLRSTGRVAVTLDGLPGARARDPLPLPELAPGGSGTVRWEVPAPDGPATRPLQALPYTLTLRHGPVGTTPVRTVHRGTLFAAGPLAPELRTVSRNDPVFGQAGEAWAIDGGGVDLWRAREEFGAVYRPGAFADGGVVTVRVTAQPATAPWARAGVVVRNDLAREGAAGFANLAVTPAHGVVLSVDGDGDGRLDTYRRRAGVGAPVWLRLSRSDGTLTARCSRDGRTWETVAAVPLPPGTAVRQDVGLFMTAAHGGSGARGTVEFDGWT